VNNRRAIALAAATALAVPAEGLRQFAYYDPPGVLTVCYGHTGTDVKRDRRYSLEECKAMLTKDMLAAVDAVERCRPGLPERVLAAFSDAAYNLGPGVACDAQKSTAARLLAAGDIPGACAQLSRWNKARVGGELVELPGLTKRRAAERALCEGRA
jgi:lysozyme